MIIGSLIFAIAMIPIVLAVSVSKIYNESKLSRVLFIYMISITIWQLYVGILYFEPMLSEETILFLVRLLRIGPTFFIPIVFYLVCTIIEDQPTLVDDNEWLKKLSMFILTKRYLYLLIAWSSFIYIINWTKLGIVGLDVAYTKTSNISFYFPKYGPLSWLFFWHMCSLLLFLILAFIVSQKMLNRDMRTFLNRVSLYSMLLFALGLLNFLPGIGFFISSIGIILYSTVIMFEFVKLNTNIKQNYYQLMERQKKLDYTGSLTASLIHEVKNTNQIIKGFSKMLNKDDSMTERDRGSVEMILKSSEHLGELADNYKEYMKTSKMALKIDDLESIIHNAIEFSQEMTKAHHVEMAFINDYKPLKAFVNSTYLEQVFINLIKNSIEACTNDKKNKKITIKTEIVNNSIFIHFHDNGKGIPIDNWESVFDPFMSFKEKGMGLGLPFVKKVIIEHLGDIRIVESTSEGTHFRIELPQNGILNMVQ